MLLRHSLQSLWSIDSFGREVRGTLDGSFFDDFRSRFAPSLSLIFALLESLCIPPEATMSKEFINDDMGI